MKQQRPMAGSGAKRAIAVLLALCLFGAAGCGKKPEPNGSGSSAPQPTVSAPDDASIPTEESTGAAADTTAAAEGTTGTAGMQTTAARGTKTTPGKQTKTTASTPATTAGTKKPSVRLSDKKTGSLGCGFYCVNMDDYGFDTKWRALAESDYVNTIFYSGTKWLPELKECNVKTWYGIHGIYEKVRTGASGWQENFDEVWQEICDTGCADAVLGWYLDEPMNMSAVKELSKYARKYGKRFFVCYTGQATDPTVFGGYIDENSHINKDNVQYLTDIAVDHYWEVKGNENTYVKLYASIHKSMPADCRVWYIPNTMTDKDLVEKSKAEQKAQGKIRIEHIRYMLEWLEKEPVKNRGGIIFFAYDFDSQDEGRYGLWNFNQHADNAWNDVLAETIRVGRDICAGKYDR